MQMVTPLKVRDDPNFGGQFNVGTNSIQKFTRSEDVISSESVNRVAQETHSTNFGTLNDFLCNL
jgi:hypothetical protein